MIYHVRHPCSLHRRRRGSGLGLPLAADEIPWTGSPWDWAATSAALVHVQGNRSGHLINAAPMSYPCLRDFCCSLSRCTDRLCEKRLANIDSSWRMEEIKGERRRGCLNGRGGIIGAQCFHEWFMQYKVAYSLGKSKIFLPELCQILSRFSHPTIVLEVKSSSCV